MFKQGDVVKRKESMWKGIEAFTLKPFDKFEVSAYFSDCKFPLVCFKESGSYQWDAAYFELVEEEKVKNRFAVGDKVICVKNTPFVQEGWIGYITSSSYEYGDIPYIVKSYERLESFTFKEDELELLTASQHQSSIEETKPTSALDKQVSGDHYKDCKIQPIEYIHANGLSYLEGNVIKYTTRHSKKNGRKDIEKAIHYLELILEMEYKDKE